MAVEAHKTVRGMALARVGRCREYRLFRRELVAEGGAGKPWLAEAVGFRDSRIRVTRESRMEAFASAGLFRGLTAVTASAPLFVFVLRPRGR